MSHHTAQVRWTADKDFTLNKYSRAHVWLFDGGARVEASASPDVVPVPYSKPEAVDPEEAFIASISSCHMLWFLDLTRRAKFDVVVYEDTATGVMEKNAAGKFWISRVALNPKVQFAGQGPSAEKLEALHHAAHEECFIANSVLTEIVTILDEPVDPT
jgi:organic hydroperoxide reductase OsmC/OhrA